MSVNKKDRKDVKLKKDFIKKAVGFILIFAISFASFSLSTVYAEGICSDNETVEFSTLEEYIEYNLPRHLYSHSFVVNGTLSYSRPVALYNFDNNSIIGSEVFIFEDNKLIGKTEIYETENGYVSTFDTFITDALFSAYQSGEEIAMGYINDNLFMYNDSDGYVYIDGFKRYDLPLETPQKLNMISIWDNVSPDFAVPYATLASIKLNVQHVHNSNRYNKGGECSFACIAMKLNYQRGYNLDADTVYKTADDLGLLVWEFGSDLTFIYTIDEPKVYSYYGCNVTGTDKRMTHNEIYQILKEDKPVAISMNKNNQEGGHEIIIKGITLETTQSTYLVDDPNSRDQRSFVLQGNPSQTYPSFSYPYSQYYDNWFYTIY